MTTYHISHNGNPHKLRTIKTVDTVEALNEANSNGQITLVRKIQRNPKLYAPRLLLRNYQSGQYKCVPSRSFHVRREGNLEFPESEWELIQSYEDYHGKNRRNPDWAAYVIPVSPAVGERFYIEDVIEEIFDVKGKATRVPSRPGGSDEARCHRSVWMGSETSA